MANLVQNLDSFTPDNLFAGHEIPVLVKGVTLEAGQGELKRGTVLGKVTATGKYKAVNSANEDGSKVADCILADDVDTTAGDATAVAYRTGHFNRKALLFGGSDTAEMHEQTLRTLGIFLSENVKPVEA